MDLECGDYFRANSDYEMHTEVQRLQSYAQTLRNKLEAEKVWLASLKSETQLMLAQKGSPFPDGCHLPQCPMSKQASAPNLSHRQRIPPNHHNHQAPATQSSPEFFMQTSFPCFQPSTQPQDVFNGGNTYQGFSTSDPSQSTLPNDEMQKLIERQNYFQKLVELDNMCKQEMARISQVGYELEPLNQLASDWNFQSQLSHPKTTLKDYISMAMAGSNIQNQGTDGRLFVQSRNCEEKIESDMLQLESDQYGNRFNNNDALQRSTNFDKKPIVIEDIKSNLAQKSNIDVKKSNQIPANNSEEEKVPPYVQADTSPREKDTTCRKIILKKEVTVLPLKKELKCTTSIQNPVAKCESLNKIKNQPPSNSGNETKSRTLKTEVDPIVWGRLAVDKKKKSLKQHSSYVETDIKENISAKYSSSDISESNFSEDDANSGQNHFTSAVEREFLRKYMYSDSDYVYSPLFVSESEEST